jgi:hypothetical protein
MGGAVVLGLSVFLAVPAAQAQDTGTAPAAEGTIYVPSGFDEQLQDVGGQGGYELLGDGLHIWTKDASTDKVAEYVDTNTPLAEVGNPRLDYTDTDEDLTDPGFQLVVDLDHDGHPDGILVGEPGAYGTHWWLPRAWTDVDLSTAPGAADGYAHSGPLEDWDAAFPSADVVAFGFSLGSGVLGDGTLHAINFAGTHYTFAAPGVALQTKDDCKGGGWATSTAPVYKNQGECVSHFAKTSNRGNGNGGADAGTGAAASMGAGPATAAGTPTTLTARNTGRNTGKVRAI